MFTFVVPREAVSDGLLIRASHFQMFISDIRYAIWDYYY